MEQRQKWLKDLREYESSIRNKQVKELCNKYDIEKMRFALRVLLDDAEAEQLKEAAKMLQ